MGKKNIYICNNHTGWRYQAMSAGILRPPLAFYILLYFAAATASVGNSWRYCMWVSEGSRLPPRGGCWRVGWPPCRTCLWNYVFIQWDTRTPRFCDYHEFYTICFLTDLYLRFLFLFSLLFLRFLGLQLMSRGHYRCQCRPALRGSREGEGRIGRDYKSHFVQLSKFSKVMTH